MSRAADPQRPPGPPRPRPARPVRPVKLDRWVRLRIIGVSAVLTLLLGAIAYRAWGLQIREGDHYRALAHRQHTATVEVPAPRGAIYDATGAELAVTADIDSVYANPREIVDLLGAAETLSRLLEVDARELEARLASPRYFVWVKRHVSAEEAQAVREAKLPGVYLTPEPRRFYPGRQLAGPVLGFAGIDGRGLDGLELTMNDLLAGQRAKAAALRDAAGRVMLPDPEAVPRPGAQVVLTLHRYIQLAAERALERAMTEFDARAGVVVVLDVQNGEVLALASWPTYDPNRPGRDREEGARNRAVTDVYEIGSIMKVFTVAAALEAGVVTPETTFDIEGGRILVGRHPIRDTYKDDTLTTGGVLKRSSNVGVVKIVRRLGKERLHDALIRFGFGKKTEVELPGEQPGLVRPHERWGEIALATASFGYGMSATPLQVAAAFAAVANGGVYHEPRVVREVRAPDGAVLYRRESEGRRVLSEETALALRPMLGSVFDKGRDGGTARYLELDGFTAGGKTGTAHKVDPATGRYGDKLYLASFAGFAPLEDPRVMTLVLIDEPRGEKYFGGIVAGPVWLEVMTATMKYMGLASGAPGEDGAKVAAAGGEIGGELEVVPVGEGGQAADDPGSVSGTGTGTGTGTGFEMPEFVGKGVPEVLSLARARGIRVELVGSGRAVQQFPPPGASSRTAECRIVFSHEPAAPPR